MEAFDVPGAKFEEMPDLEPRTSNLERPLEGL
jgi:hypothetical protein